MMPMPQLSPSELRELAESLGLPLDGAELEASYPVAALPEGIALNITVSSYAGRLDCGAIACRRSLPEADRIIDLMEDALVDLEEVAGITT